MATPTETAADQSSPPSLEELARRSARNILLPYIIGYSSSAAAALSDQPRELAIIVNPRDGSLTVIEGSIDVESLLGKDGRVPASKASIEALPLVRVAEEGLDCAICLAEFEVGEEAKQMPCKHRYHANCIEKWLGIQGSCPVCRHRMPEEEEKDNANGEDEGNDSDGEGEDDEEEDEAGGGASARIPAFIFHIYFAPRRRRSNSGSRSDAARVVESTGASESDDNSSSTEDAGGSENTEVDSESSSQEMDMDHISE